MKIEKKYIGVRFCNKGTVIPDFSVSSFRADVLSLDSIEKNQDDTITLSIRGHSDFGVQRHLNDLKNNFHEWKDYDSIYSVTLSKKELEQITRLITSYL